MALGAVAALKARRQEARRRQDRHHRRHQGRRAGHRRRLDRRRHRVQPALRPARLPGARGLLQRQGRRREDHHLRQGVHEGQRRAPSSPTPTDRRSLAEAGRAGCAARHRVEADRTWTSHGRRRREPPSTCGGVASSFAGVVALDRVVARPCAPARCTPWSARTAPASPPSSRSSPACTGRTAARSATAASRSPSPRPRDAQAAGISTIYQEVNLVPLMSVAAQPVPRPRAAQPARPDRLRPDAPRGRARSWPATASTSTSAGRCGELGLGVQQMVALARAVSTDARVVIMDEPTSSLEPREVDRLLEVDRRAARAGGVAVLYVSHKLDEVFRLCDRVTVLRDGRRGAHRRRRRHRPAAAGRHDARPRRRRGPPSTASPASATSTRATPATAGAAGRRADPPARARRASASTCTPGEVVGPGRPARLRPHRDRQGHLRRATRSTPATVSVDGAPLAALDPGRRDPRPASACCPRTARPRASSPTSRCARTSCWPRCPG